MYYAKLNNDNTASWYSISELKKDNPNTSFPKTMPEEELAKYGVVIVEPDLTVPNVNDSVEYIQLSDPFLVGNKWTAKYEIHQRSEEECALNIRGVRNDKLVASDWTQIADVPVNKELWATYRQALRDITSQSGFPYDVTWPTEPA